MDVHLCLGQTNKEKHYEVETTTLVSTPVQVSCVIAVCNASASSSLRSDRNSRTTLERIIWMDRAILLAYKATSFDSATAGCSL